MAVAFSPQTTRDPHKADHAGSQPAGDFRGADGRPLRDGADISATRGGVATESADGAYGRGGLSGLEHL